MPALSQNFLFTVNSATTTALVYPNTATSALTFFSDKLKGDGYYGSSDGFHTIQSQITEFEGKIEIQGTLSTSPTDSDWFPIDLTTTISGIDTTGAITSLNLNSINYTIPTTNVKIYNFTGNFVWVRAKISDWVSGSVNGIKFNH